MLTDLLQNVNACFSIMLIFYQLVSTNRVLSYRAACVFIIPLSFPISLTPLSSVLPLSAASWFVDLWTGSGSEF